MLPLMRGPSSRFLLSREYLLWRSDIGGDIKRESTYLPRAHDSSAVPEQSSIYGGLSSACSVSRTSAGLLFIKKRSRHSCC